LYICCQIINGILDVISILTRKIIIESYEDKQNCPCFSLRPSLSSKYHTDSQYKNISNFLSPPNYGLTCFDIYENHAFWRKYFKQRQYQVPWQLWLKL